MGALGSGRRCGDHPTRPIVEDTPALGITKIKKQLVPGTLIKQTFPNNFKVLIEVHDKSLSVTFPTGRTIKQQTIQITKQPCHFGGSRFFMLCAWALDTGLNAWTEARGICIARRRYDRCI